MKTRTFLRFAGKLWENGEFEPAIGWETQQISQRPHADPEHQLQIIDDSGNVLVEGAVELRVAACHTKGTDGMTSAKVVGYVPLHPEGRLVVFRRGERVLHQVELESEKPTIMQVDVKVDECGCIHVRWEAKHSRPLCFSLFFIDGNRRAISIERNTIEKQFVFETSQLPGGSDCALVVLASDGLRSAVARSDSFDIPEKPPRLAIMSPGEGATLNSDQLISLLGHAHDLAGRALPDEGLIWSVDSEVIVRGKRLALAGPFAPGQHRIGLEYLQDSKVVIGAEVIVSVSERTPEQEEWLKVSQILAPSESTIKESLADQNLSISEVQCEGSRNSDAAKDDGLIALLSRPLDGFMRYIYPACKTPENSNYLLAESIGKLPSADAASTQYSSSTQALVNWQLLADVGTALVITANCPVERALSLLPPLLGRLMHPHRLLDELYTHVDSVLAGDSFATRKLREQLDMLVSSCPELVGSRERAQNIVGSSNLDDYVDKHEEHHDESTISFDALVRLQTAVALATTDYPAAAFDAILDVILGLTMLTSAANHLAKGLARGGPTGVAEALNKLRLLGHWTTTRAPAPMWMMIGGLGGIPGGMPGGRPTPDGGPLGRPKDYEDVLGIVNGIVDHLQNRKHWDPEIWDMGLIPWREIVGWQPLEVIDRAEIKRFKCYLALIKAMKLRQEPPPPRPALVVWSNTITGIVPSNGCSGDRIVINGNDFGKLDVNIGVMLPMTDGCQAFPISAGNWTPTAITVTLPNGIASGPVGLVDIGYVRVYDEWAIRMNELTKSIIENAICSRSKVPDVAYVPLFRECAPLTSVNHLRAGLPAIKAFKINGADVVFIEPGTPVVLEWTIRNVEKIKLIRVSNVGPKFSGSLFVDNPAGTSYNLGPFIGDRPEEATYELHVTGPCGETTARVTAKLRKVPILLSAGVEVTQGIQTFRDPNAPSNSIPLVAFKDTIVRVYVAVENLGGYKPNGGTPNEVRISGEARIAGYLLSPLNEAIALPSAQIQRWQTNHTLNFKIPAYLAIASKLIQIKVWAVNEVETPPLGMKIRPMVWSQHNITWIDKAPFKVRYVRIGHDSVEMISDQKAREVILRAFDLLATPPLNIEPARLATWHTSLDLSTRDGISDLLSHIDDQHDCTTFEAILPWTDECPDDDGAVWVGITSRSEWGGMSQGFRLFDKSRNTVIVAPEQDNAAHEMGHTLKLNHVNENLTTSKIPDGPFDDLPDGGKIQPGDAFDPATGKVVEGYVFLYDFMTYGPYRWVSRTNWMRVFDKF